MSVSPENIPWELLARYVAGECSPQEVAALSARIETEPAVAAALADVLLQGVAVRDDAVAHPERAHVPAPAPATRSAWLSPAIFALAASVVAALVTVWFFAFGDRDRDILRITALDGSVRWTGRGGEVRDAFKPGDSLPGGLLETLSDDSTVTLAFADKTTLTLLSHSAAALSDDGQKRVHLREGALSAEVKPQPAGRPLLVRTPTAALEVLGTRFDVDSDAANTRLSVNEGRVRVTRLADGRVVEVQAQHEVIASLNRAEDFRPTPRGRPEVIWRSDFANAATGAQGRWLSGDASRPARLAAEPARLNNTSRGDVTIHRVAVTIPWQDLKTVQVQPGSRVVIKGRCSTGAPLEVMLLGRKLGGGLAGNFFREVAVPQGAWQVEGKVGDFQKSHIASGVRPPEAMQLHHIAIYTINTDAGLEIESVEVLRE